MHGGLFLSGRPPVRGLRVRGCLLGARYGSITTVQVTVEAVPPSTCELMLTVTSVSGVLWKLTVSPTYGLSVQVAVLSTVTCLSFASTWYPAGTVSCTV